MKRKPVIPIISAVVSFVVAAFYLWFVIAALSVAIPQKESAADIAQTAIFLVFPIIAIIAGVLQYRREYTASTIVGAMITPLSIAIWYIATVMLMIQTPDTGLKTAVIVYPGMAILYLGIPLSFISLIAVVAGTIISKRDASLLADQTAATQPETALGQNPVKTAISDVPETPANTTAASKQTNPQSSSKGVRAVTVIVAMLLALTFFFAYDFLETAEMIENGDMWIVVAIAYVGFVLVISFGLVISSRTMSHRLPAAILLLSACAVASTTGELMETAQLHIHSNGDVGSALTAGFAQLVWQASGTMMAVLAIVILATAAWSAKHDNGTRKVPLIVCSVIAVLVAAAPFAYGYVDANYLKPAREEKALEEFKQENVVFIDQLEKRGLLEEGDKNLINDEGVWVVGISGGDWHIEYRGWEIKYNEEHESWRAWTSPSDDLTVYAYEDAGYGISAYPDHIEEKRVHVMADNIDAATLEAVSNIVGEQKLTQGNFKLVDGELVPYAVTAEDIAAAKSTYDDRGFPNDSSGGFSWTDDHDLTWTVYLRGDKSYASTYVMNDDHSTVKHTVVVAQDPYYVRDGDDVDIIKVDRVDVETLNSKSSEARRLLGQ